MKLLYNFLYIIKNKNEMLQQTNIHDCLLVNITCVDGFSSEWLFNKRSYFESPCISAAATFEAFILRHLTSRNYDITRNGMILASTTHGTE